MDKSASSTDLVAQVKARLNLAEHVIIPDIGTPQRQGHRLVWRCPFHEDHHPSLFLNTDGQSYRCFGCGARGDALTWVMARNGWAFREALAYLANLVGVPMTTGAARPVHIRGRTSRPTPPAPPVVPPDATWQARARLILGRAQEVLWSDAGDVGRAYLQERGLQENTLRAWGLGWCPRDVFDPPERWGLTGKRIYVPRCVVIPHWVGDELWALKVRRFVGDATATADSGGKYGGPRGGQITLYGAEKLQGDRPLFIAEAELDALLLWQAAGDLVDVVALAGADVAGALHHRQDDVKDAQLMLRFWQDIEQGEQDRAVVDRVYGHDQVRLFAIRVVQVYFIEAHHAAEARRRPMGVFRCSQVAFRVCVHPLVHGGLG